VLDALSLQPEYLRNAASASGAVTDFEHLQLPLGRRFRALKLWFLLLRFGAGGIRAHLRQGVALREAFERRLTASGGDGGRRFELAAPPSLSPVWIVGRRSSFSSSSSSSSSSCSSGSSSRRRRQRRRQQR
jgi:aromatic-L-amino-acid decarboxylase